MTQSNVNPKRFDPYKNFKFRVRWKGRCVAGIAKVSGVKRTNESVVDGIAGDAGTKKKSPEKSIFEAVTLEHGVTHDPEFEQWMSTVSSLGSEPGEKVSLKDFCKDINIEMYNESGKLVVVYRLFRCWVSEYQALPEVDANASGTAIQIIKLENKGWEIE